MKHRRLLVTIAIASLTVIPASGQDDDGPLPVEVSRLKGNLYQLRCDGNVGVVASVGEDGTLLVDTGYGRTAAHVREELTKLGSEPAKIIVNTHGDGDHVGGNGELGAGAVIIAHPEVRRQMTRYFALPALDTGGLPTVDLGGGATIHFNGEEIRVLPVPGGHTSADMIVHFTGSRVVCIGDLMLAGTFPNADPARGGDAQRLAEILAGLTTEFPGDTTLVASHGGAVSMDDLKAYTDMVTSTISAVAAEVSSGLSLEEIVARNPLAEWGEWERPGGGLSFESWTTAIYSSLQGTYRASICAPVTEVLVSDGADAAVARYRQLKKDAPDEWSFAEGELNMLGYQLLARDKIDDAIAIFELNVEAFPDAFNPYDSLGEAFLAAGRTDEAVANYQRSLELNPENTNAAAVLARIREP